MEINRQILLKHTDLDTAHKILCKARNFNITFDKMARTRANSIYPTVHFLKADWIEAQKAHINRMRKDCVKINTELLKFVETIKG